MSMPRILFEAAASAARISGVPRVPSSPRVKSTMPDFFARRHSCQQRASARHFYIIRMGAKGEDIEFHSKDYLE